MKHSGILRFAVPLACLMFASAAAAETIYKYRRADGRVTYSNRLVPGLELIETFEYKIDAPVRAPNARAAAKSDLEGEARVTKYLAALDAAWKRVQDATRDVALAEERLSAGTEPQGGDWQATVADSAPPSAGGVPAAAPPAIGGPMSGRRGRASPEYVARISALEADVAAARKRLDDALRSYNQLR